MNITRDGGRLLLFQFPALITILSKVMRHYVPWASSQPPAKTQGLACIYRLGFPRKHFVPKTTSSPPDSTWLFSTSEASAARTLNSARPAIAGHWNKSSRRPLGRRYERFYYLVRKKRTRKMVGLGWGIIIWHIFTLRRPSSLSFLSQS